MHPERVRQLNQAQVRAEGSYVLYWAQMNRRVSTNHGLELAINMANRLELPVLFYEGLTCSYPHSSDRFHTFLLEGVQDTASRLRALGIGYLFICVASGPILMTHSTDWPRRPPRW